MKIEINFTDVPIGNESGAFVINPYWLEHNLNLFYQGYSSEVWKEIIDTEINYCKLLENDVLGTIGREFDGKHLMKKIEKLKINIQQNKNRKILNKKSLKKTERTGFVEGGCSADLSRNQQPLKSGL